MDSTESARAVASQVILQAAEGRLPAWAVASPDRREHMARVAALMDEWATALRLSEADRVRWRAVAWLHDALRDEAPEVLRRELPAPWNSFAGPLLHGPAVAERLREELDPAMLAAIRYHTLGHASLDRLGRALYLADFLEPGRDFLPDWRAALRARMPAAMDEVLLEVLAARLRHLIDGRKPIRGETASFWSAVLAEGRS